MGELRGRPDQPSDEPDKPANPAPDRARAPGPPPDKAKVPRELREAFRRAEEMFEDPRRVGVRYVTDRNPDTGPTSISPYRTSKDRPEPEPKEEERTDELTAHTLEVEKPLESPPIEAEDIEIDPPSRSSFDKFSRKLVENVEDVHDWADTAVSKVSIAVDRVRPTGQHVGARPDDRGSNFHAADPHSALDGGSLAAATLAAGMLIGHASRLAHRKAAERKEGRNARNG